MPVPGDKEVKPSPLGKFITRFSRGFRSKSPTKVTQNSDSKLSLDAPKHSPFGNIASRLSLRRRNKINKEKALTPTESNEDLSTQLVQQSPRTAVSESDLRFVTIRRGTEMPVTPLSGAPQFMSEDNLSTPLGETNKPTRIPSYVNISCSLNGYRSPRPIVDNTPIRPRPVGKSLLQLRLQQLNQLNSPQVTSTGSQYSTSATSVTDSPMGAAVSSPSVKSLIGQFDRLNLCSDLDNSDMKENVKPHQIVVDQPEPVKSVMSCVGDVKASTSSKSEEEKTGNNKEEKENDEAPAQYTRSGQEFNELLESTRRSLEEQSARANSDLESMQTMPESAADAIRMASGKAHLLLRKKLTKFEELVGANLNPETAAKKTTSEDLEGYWGLVEIELIDINKCFSEVDDWRARNYKEIIRDGDSEKEEMSLSMNNNKEKPVTKKLPSRHAPTKVVSEKQKAGEEERRKALAEAKKRAKQRAAEEAAAKPEGLFVL